MKTTFLVILLSIFTAQAQEGVAQDHKSIQIGDILTIGKPSTQKYEYIRFPKPNFIIKSGGIVNYKALIGSNVSVTHVSKNQEGQTEITIKKTNGKKFFNTTSIVKVNLEKALEEKEIVLLQ